MEVDLEDDEMYTFNDDTQLERYSVPSIFNNTDKCRIDTHINFE